MMAEVESSYYFHFSIDPDRPGLRCKVNADPHLPLLELARQAFLEVKQSHPRHLLNAELPQMEDWIYLFGQLDIGIEELEPDQTPYDLAIMPGGTIYLGPRSGFKYWMERNE